MARARHLRVSLQVSRERVRLPHEEEQLRGADAKVLELSVVNTQLQCELDASRSELVHAQQRLLAGHAQQAQA